MFHFLLWLIILIVVIMYVIHNLEMAEAPPFGGHPHFANPHDFNFSEPEGLMGDLTILISQIHWKINMYQFYQMARL